MSPDRYLLIQITKTQMYVQLTKLKRNKVLWTLTDEKEYATKLREKTDADIIDIIERKLKNDNVNYEKRYFEINIKYEDIKEQG